MGWEGSGGGGGGQTSAGNSGGPGECPPAAADLPSPGFSFDSRIFTGAPRKARPGRRRRRAATAPHACPRQLTSCPSGACSAAASTAHRRPYHAGRRPSRSLGVAVAWRRSTRTSCGRGGATVPWDATLLRCRRLALPRGALGVLFAPGGTVRREEGGVRDRRGLSLSLGSARGDGAGAWWGSADGGRWQRGHSLLLSFDRRSNQSLESRGRDDSLRGAPAACGGRRGRKALQRGVEACAKERRDQWTARELENVFRDSLMPGADLGWAELRVASARILLCTLLLTP